jgi:hypothetical protein
MKDRKSMLLVAPLFFPSNTTIKVVPVKAVSRKGLALMAQMIGMPRVIWVI